MPDEDIAGRRMLAEFANLIAMALQCAGALGGSTFRGTLDDLLAVPQLAAALDDDERELVSAALALMGVDEEDAEASQIAERLALLLPQISRKLVGATQLMQLTRIRAPRTLGPDDTIQDALTLMAEGPHAFVAYVPDRGEPGLISLSDLGAWLSAELTRNPYDAPVPSATSLASGFDTTTRTWRTVLGTITVLELSQMFGRPDRGIEAVLVLGRDGLPAGIVTPSDLSLWERPSRSMRNRASSLLDSWRSRRNLRARASSSHGDALGIAPELCATLIALEPVSFEPLRNSPEEASRLAAAVFDLLEGPGAAGASPALIYAALQGESTPEEHGLRLDAQAAFGCGRGLTVTYVGEVLQRLVDAGLITAAAPGVLRRSPEWDLETPLGWLDTEPHAESDEEPEPSAGQPGVGSAAFRANAAAPTPQASLKCSAPARGEAATPRARRGSASAAQHSAPIATSTGKTSPAADSGAAHAPAASACESGSAAGGRSVDGPRGRNAARKSVRAPARNSSSERSRRKPLAPLKPLPYTAYEGQRQMGSFFKAANILSVTLAVVRFEGPIASTLLMRRVAGFWGVSKITPKVRDRFREVLPQTGTRGGIVASQFGGETFYMTADQKARPSVRTNTRSKSGRSSAEIPLEEFQVVFSHELWDGPLTREVLIKHACEVFGLDASKQAPRKAASLAIDELAAKGRLAVRGKLISLP